MRRRGAQVVRGCSWAELNPPKIWALLVLCVLSEAQDSDLLLGSSIRGTNKTHQDEITLGVTWAV